MWRYLVGANACITVGKKIFIFAKKPVPPSTHTCNSSIGSFRHSVEWFSRFIFFSANFLQAASAHAHDGDASVLQHIQLDVRLRAHLLTRLTRCPHKGNRSGATPLEVINERPRQQWAHTSSASMRFRAFECSKNRTHNVKLKHFGVVSCDVTGTKHHNAIFFVCVLPTDIQHPRNMRPLTSRGLNFASHNAIVDKLCSVKKFRGKKETKTGYIDVLHLATSNSRKQVCPK